jgi:hypothetical protein
VAVAADDGGAGQREALFGTDDVHDALTLVALVEIVDAKVLGVLRQRLDLDAAFFLGDALGTVGRRHIVVDDGKGLFRVAHLASGHAQAFERLRRGHFVDKMAVDVEKAGAILRLVDEVVVPDLVIKCARLGHL